MARRMPHIERIVWREPNWLPESPDQYPDGLPPRKPEAWPLALDPGADHWWDSNRILQVFGWQFGDTVELQFLDRIEPPGEDQDPPPRCIRVPPTWPPGDPIGEERFWLPMEAIDIPADRVLEVVDALLYVHRRTHEHDYDGLVTEGGDDGEA